MKPFSVCRRIASNLAVFASTHFASMTTGVLVICACLCGCESTHVANDPPRLDRSNRFRESNAPVWFTGVVKRKNLFGSSLNNLAFLYFHSLLLLCCIVSTVFGASVRTCVPKIESKSPR